MDDAAWLTLCVFEEARGEPQDGKAAVAKVILNRTNRKPPFFSDGTIKGTILRKDQFSWAYFSMIDGRYTRICSTPAEAEALAQKLYLQAIAQKLVFAACEDAAEAVLKGVYTGGDGYERLGPDALLYCNLKVSQPAWATPDKLICQVGAHSFFRV